MRRLAPSPNQRWARGLFCVGVLLLVAHSGSSDETTSELLMPALFCFAAALLGPPLYDFLRLRDASLDRALLALELADLLEAGIPIPAAITQLAARSQRYFKTAHTSMALALASLAQELPRGTSLARAIALTQRFPIIWEALLSHSAALDQAAVLRRLGRFELTERELRTPWRALISLLGGVLAANFLATYILPSFVAIFEGMGQRLPWTTRLLMLGHHDFGVSIPALVALALVLIGGLVVWDFRLDPGWLPGLRRLAGLSDQAQAAETLVCAVDMELPIPECLALAAASCSTRRYQVGLQRLAEQSRAGMGLAAALDGRPDLFDAPLRWAARQGEQHEQLAPALAACGQFLAEEYRRGLRRLTVGLEVAGLVAVGGLALLLAVSCMMPLVEICRQASQGGL